MTAPSPQTRASSVARLARWLPAAMPLALGAFFGYEAAYSTTLPGLSSITGGVLFLLLGVAIAVVGSIGFVLVARNRRSSGIGALVAAGCLLVGGAAGAIAVRALDRGYHEPVVLYANGTASLAMTRDDFAPSVGGVARCVSVADGDAVDSVTALDLGELGPGTLRAMFGAAASDGATSMSLFIDGADTNGGPQAMWDGTATIATEAGGASGTATFADLAFLADPKIGGSATGWPASLSGTLTWTCDAWARAAEAPPTTGRLTVTFADGTLAPPADVAPATCEGHGISGSIGVLQAQPFSAELDLATARVGGAINLWIKMDMGASKELPAGLQYAPNWAGEGTVTTLSPNGLSGTATFTDLATGVDPAIGPAPTGWPTTISGTVSWDCG